MRASLIIPLFLCSALNAAERGLAESVYDRHVIFDQCIPARSYYQSEVLVTAPSAIDLIDGRIPLDTEHFVVPADSLRLTWVSATGGDWRATLKTRARYGLVDDFDGDTVTFWCFSDTGLTPDEAPRIHLEDIDTAGTLHNQSARGRTGITSLRENGPRSGCRFRRFARSIGALM